MSTEQMPAASSEFVAYKTKPSPRSLLNLEYISNVKLHYWVLVNGNFISGYLTAKQKTHQLSVQVDKRKVYQASVQRAKMSWIELTLWMSTQSPRKQLNKRMQPKWTRRKRLKTRTSSLFLHHLARCAPTLTRTQSGFPSSNTRRESGEEVKDIHLHCLHLLQLICSFHKERVNYNIHPIPHHQCPNELSNNQIANFHNIALSVKIHV